MALLRDIPLSSDPTKEVDDLSAYSLQPGVVSGGDPSVPSASLVRIAAGSAWVPTGTGVYRRVSWAQQDVTIPAPTTYTRLDQIVVDSTGAVTRLGGTEVNGASLINRAGSVALPTGQLRLADALVTPATLGPVGVSAANTRDRRPWSGGLLVRKNFPGPNTGLAGLSYYLNAYLRTRCEFSGLYPVRATVQSHVTASGGGLYIEQDFRDVETGAVPDFPAGGVSPPLSVGPTNRITNEWVWQPPVAAASGGSSATGSYLHDVVFAQSGASITMVGCTLSIEELVGRNVGGNGAT